MDCRQYLAVDLIGSAEHDRPLGAQNVCFLQMVLVTSITRQNAGPEPSYRSNCFGIRLLLNDSYPVCFVEEFGYDQESLVAEAADRNVAGNSARQETIDLAAKELEQREDGGVNEDQRPDESCNLERQGIPVGAAGTGQIENEALEGYIEAVRQACGFILELEPPVGPDGTEQQHDGDGSHHATPAEDPGRDRFWASKRHRLGLDVLPIFPPLPCTAVKALCLRRRLRKMAAWAIQRAAMNQSASLSIGPML